MAGLRNEETRPMAAEASANAVFQSYALLPHMSVAGNLAFRLEMPGRDLDRRDLSTS